MRWDQVPHLRPCQKPRPDTTVRLQMCVRSNCLAVCVAWLQALFGQVAGSMHARFKTF